MGAQRLDLWIDDGFILCTLIVSPFPKKVHLREKNTLLDDIRVLDSVLETLPRSTQVSTSGLGLTFT
jgi:hypothetical protein